MLNGILFSRFTFPMFASIQSNFCGITFSNEEVCFNVSGPTSINIINHGNLVANPTQFSNSSLYDTCWLSGPSSVLCNGDNTFGKLGQNWTFPIVSNNSFAQLTTPKPLSSIVTESYKNYFIYNDGTAGFIGRKATGLHGASAIIKDPR